VIGVPPLKIGAVNDTVAWPLPSTAVTAVGASGTVTGVIGSDGIDDNPSPTALVAVTVNVYGVPFARPVIEIGDAFPVAVKFPGLEVTLWNFD